MLIKVYKAASEGERGYPPAEIAGVEEVPVMVAPALKESALRLWSARTSA
jgi:hypothetical protein